METNTNAYAMNARVVIHPESKTAQSLEHTLDGLLIGFHYQDSANGTGGDLGSSCHPHADWPFDAGRLGPRNEAFSRPYPSSTMSGLRSRFKGLLRRSKPSQTTDEATAIIADLDRSTPSTSKIKTKKEDLGFLELAPGTDSVVE